MPHFMSVEGVLLPLAFITAAVGLFSGNALSLPLPLLNPCGQDKKVFMYGGSTSVGSTAFQLAKAAGLEVVAAASKRDFEPCKALGADSVIDYTDHEWLDQSGPAVATEGCCWRL